MRARIALGLLLSALAVLPARAQTPAAAPYEIHVIEALSGGGAFLGTAEGQALALFEQAVNQNGGIQGRPLKFVYHDDQTNPQTAVQLANDILADKPAVVLVSSVVAVCNAVAPLFQDNGPVMYCFAPGIHPAPGSYAYSMNTSTVDLAAASIRYWRMRGVKRLAIITSTDGSGQDAEKALLAAVADPANKGVIQIVANEHFNPADVSVSAQIENIKAAKPQLLFAWSTGAPIATVFRAVQQAGLDVPVETTDGNMTYAQMTRFADFLPKQLYIHSSPWMVDGNPAIKLPAAVTAKQKEFYGAFRASGVEPDVAAVLGWDPANIVVGALKKLGPDASAQAINDYLQHLQGFAGVAGIYNFVKTPQRGLDIDNAIVTRWNPEKKRFLPVSQLGGVPLGK